VVVIENVLNLRTMVHPESSLPFDRAIAEELGRLGYSVDAQVYRVSGYGVPQTRRRFVFIAFRDGFPDGWHAPEAGPAEAIRPHVWDLGQGGGVGLANHAPEWGFGSSVHVATGEPFDSSEDAVVVRFSRTASDGNPVRSFDQPMPAIDTATVWGWAQGNVRASRVEKDRKCADAKFIRNADSKAKLWRISASRLRSMTHREFARLQTFPDDWEFLGNSLRDVQLQIGNAVPVEFARRLAMAVAEGLASQDERRPYRPPAEFEAASLRLF
jgi:DNA (cytosine-5)-methyltransferase 1